MELKDVLSVDWLEERVNRLPNKVNEYGYDPFGMRLDSIKKAAPLLYWLYKYYFRCESRGVENLPDGRMMIAANHGGLIPYDALMLISAIFLEAEPPRLGRGMLERFVPHFPVVGTLFSRLGQVTGHPKNCRYLLENGEVIVVFPEGVKAISKPVWNKYNLLHFGNGFMRLALETNSPIVPVGIVGSEEQFCIVHDSKLSARLMGLPVFPVSLSFPWLGLLGLLPLPVKYRLYFGEPIQFKGNPNDDDHVIEKKVERVRTEIKKLVRNGLKTRKSWFT